jgi:hypothetical protein
VAWQVKSHELDFSVPQLAQKILEHMNRELLAGAEATAKRDGPGAIAHGDRLAAGNPENGSEAANGGDPLSGRQRQ